MLSGVDAGRIYLACGATDMRKSIDGLAAIVSFRFELDVFSESWFVFCNRARDKLKSKRTTAHTLPSLEQAGYDETVLEWTRGAA